MTTWALRTGAEIDAVNVHLAVLEDAGLIGIAEETPVGGAPQTTLYFPQRVDDLPVDGTWVEVPERDWHERWKESIEPVTVGPVTIAPPWLVAAVPAGSVPVVIDMGQAFGTGHHETTTGCLAALAEMDLGRRSVLDVGTGTGVLAIAARLLGAARVVGCDVDPLATAAASANAARNGVPLELHTGSLGSVPAGTFDVVVANLDTATLTSLACDLVARLAPRGVLIASGVSIERRDEAVAAFAEAGLPVQDRAGAEWVVLTGSSSPT